VVAASEIHQDADREEARGQDRAREIHIMACAIWLPPSHGSEPPTRLRNVREDDNEQADRRDDSQQC